MKVIDRVPAGAALLPLSSLVALRQFSPTLRQTLPTISTSKVAGWPASNVWKQSGWVELVLAEMSPITLLMIR